MKATALLKGKPDAQGRQKVYVRLSDKQKRLHFVTDLWIHPDHFAKGRVLTNHPHHELLNKRIRSEILKREAEAVGLFEKKNKVPRTTLQDYIDTCLIQWDKTKGSETLRQDRSEQNILKEFAPTLLLTEITADWCYKYQGYLYSIGNSGNTVWKHFKFIKKIVRKALKEGLMTVNPFDTFPMPKYRDPKRVFLTREELDEIEAFLEDCPPELYHAGTWFLIACFTGLRRSDLLAFDRKKNIIGGRLIVHTQKTDDIVSLPLSERVKGYFERIQYKPLGITGEHYNRLLKVIMAGVGIDKVVSSHCARHTAAIMMANSGLSIEVVGKILGQKSPKVTQVYFKLSGKRIDDEYKRLS